MNPETRNLLTERYTSWSESWAISLAFAVTQSVEKAERIVADAIVALIAIEAEEEAVRVREARAKRFHRDVAAEITENATPALQSRAGSSNSATRFAATVWELASREAYRGFGADTFFRMPAVARAIVILKIKAQFSRDQIAGLLKLTPAQVEDHLENARLLFSDGRPWVESSPNVHGAQVLSSSADGKPIDVQTAFASYVGNDLDHENGARLQGHLVECSTCRSSFAQFKRQYTDWANSVPVIEPAPELRKHLTKITRSALKIRRRDLFDTPSPLPGLRRLLRNSQINAMVLGAIFYMGFQLFLAKNPHLKAAIRNWFR